MRAWLKWIGAAVTSLFPGKIRRVELSYGLGSERPLVGAIFRVILLVVGIGPLRLSTCSPGRGTFTLKLYGTAFSGGGLLNTSAEERFFSVPTKG